jgi:hypothetical protein
LLSRFAFIGTHVVFFYWFNFLLNDPFSVGTNTLDARKVLPEGQCQHFNKENALFDLGLFALWWGTHSTFARKAYKVLHCHEACKQRGKISGCS